MVASTAPLTERRCHEKAVHDLLARIDLAADKGIDSLTVLSGNRNPGLSDDAAVNVVCEALARVLAHADKARVTLNLELLNSKVDHKGYQADHTAWGLAVLRRLRSSRLKLLYDIYHMQIMEGDIIRTIQTNIDQIGHFHTGGVPGRAELDDSQELNYRAVCRAIAATNYSGYISHEFRPRGDLLAGLRQAYEICQVGEGE
jgi:hydroxypyruvate isomerase